MKNFNKFTILLLIAMGSVDVQAQIPSIDQTTNMVDPWHKEGQLISIQISRGNPIRIFVAGREEAKIDTATVDLEVRRLKPYPGKILKVDRFNNYFVISDSAEFNKATALEIVTKLKEKTETFKFELKPEAK